MNGAHALGWTGDQSRVYSHPGIGIEDDDRGIMGYSPCLGISTVR